MPFKSIRSYFVGRRRSLALIFATILLAMGAHKSALTAPITTTIHFEASGFGDGAPTDPVIGTVSLVFDANGGEVLDQPVVDIDLTIGNKVYLADEVGFQYIPSNAGGELTIGGKITGVNLLQFSAIDDFALVITDTLSGTPVFGSFFYGVNEDVFNDASSNSLLSSTVSGIIVDTSNPPPLIPLFFTEAGRVTFVVPEPGTLSLLSVSLLGLVALRRRIRAV